LKIAQASHQSVKGWIIPGEMAHLVGDRIAKIETLEELRTPIPEVLPVLRMSLAAVQKFGVHVQMKHRGRVRDDAVNGPKVVTLNPHLVEGERGSGPLHLGRKANGEATFAAGNSQAVRYLPLPVVLDVLVFPSCNEVGETLSLIDDTLDKNPLVRIASSIDAEPSPN